MNQQTLQTFLAILDTGSLVRASEALNVTQSTVTARLQTLEEEMGQPLLHRSKSGVTLTAAGVRFQRYAETITGLWRQARQEVALPAGLPGLCNLACDHRLWPGLGEHLFNAIKTRHPDIAMSIWLGSMDEVARWLNEGKSDLALTHRSAIGPRQGQLALPMDEIILVSTLPDGPIRFDPGYVFVENGEAFGRDHAAAYADADTARLSFGDPKTGLAHILTSGGSAYLPRRMAEDHIKEGTLHVLQDAPVFHRKIYLTFNEAAKQDWDWFDPVLSQFL